MLTLAVLSIWGCSKKADVGPASTSTVSKGDTLFTFNLGEDYGFYNETYFFVTDADGNILSETKHQAGTSIYALVAAKAYSGTRINAYEVDMYSDSSTSTYITAYLQVKKGTVLKYGTSSPSSVKVYLNNIPDFDGLYLSTNDEGWSVISPQYLNPSYSFPCYENSKFYVQVRKNGQVKYNFFDIPQGASTLNVDVSQCTKVPLTKSFTAPGDVFGMNVFAKPDIKSLGEYNLGSVSSPLLSNNLTYYYPSESFQQYSTVYGYYKNNLAYSFVNVGSSIPDQIDTYSTSFSISGSTMADVKPTVSGSYDYYYANFESKYLTNASFSVLVWSPSAANYTDFKLPDFSKYTGKATIDASAMYLQNFSLYQVDGFNETTLPYRVSGSNHDVNMKVVQGSYTNN